MKTISALLLATSSVLTAQTVTLSPDGTFATDEVERDAFGFAEAFPDPNAANAILYDSNYGPITTGNTLNRADFIAAMDSAFAGGFGGVYGFEDVPLNTIGSQLDFSTGSAGTVSVVAGPNHYVESRPSDETYRGKQTSRFDGTGPSPNDPRGTPPSLFSIGQSGSKTEIGLQILQGATSFDLDFDIADQVSVIGFAHMNYINFQSFQQGPNMDYANIHTRVTWSNGVTTVTQQAVQFSQSSDGNETYFGFIQPDPGFYLDRLEFYQIGNESRSFIAIDELGLVVGDFAQKRSETISSIDVAGGNVILEIDNSDASRSYSIDGTSDLTLPFEPVPGQTAPGNGGTLQFTIPVSGDQGFFGASSM